MRAKKQRDTLLKQQKSYAIECFEEKMAEHGSYLIEKRAFLINQIQPLFISYAKKLLMNKELRLDYIPSSKELLRTFQTNRQKEFFLGNTLQGPHRDEYSFNIDNKPARIFASEGQKRACILALRLAEYQKMKENSKYLIFCIDDMITHFDTQRQNSLATILNELKQVFISFPNKPLNTIEGKQFFIKEGTLVVVKI